MSDERFSNDRLLEIMVTIFAIFSLAFLYLKVLFF